MSVAIERGQKIVVLDGERRELGEGTFISRDRHGEMTVYECREHTILAKGEHYVRVGGETHKVKP